MYNINNLIVNITNHRDLAKLDEKNRVPSIVAIVVMAGYSDFTNATVFITLPKWLLLYSSLVAADSHNYWNLTGSDRKVKLMSFFKAGFMKFNGSALFRELGDNFTVSGGKAPFNQKEGSKGDPKKATFLQILTSCIAEHPFVSGEGKSVDVDLRWSPTEGETTHAIDRSCSTVDYWSDGTHKTSMAHCRGSTTWKGFDADGKPLTGESWKKFSWDNEENPTVPQLNKDGGGGIDVQVLQEGDESQLGGEEEVQARDEDEDDEESQEGGEPEQNDEESDSDDDDDEQFRQQFGLSAARQITRERTDHEDLYNVYNTNDRASRMDSRNR